MQSTLRDEARGTSERRRSRDLRGLLVAGQIALCVSLLAGAGLLVRSLWAITATPFGLDAEGVLRGVGAAAGAGYRDGGVARRASIEQLRGAAARRCPA